MNDDPALEPLKEFWTDEKLFEMAVYCFNNNNLAAAQEYVNEYKKRHNKQSIDEQNSIK